MFSVKQKINLIQFPLNTSFVPDFILKVNCKSIRGPGNSYPMWTRDLIMAGGGDKLLNLPNSLVVRSGSPTPLIPKRDTGYNPEAIPPNSHLQNASYYLITRNCLMPVPEVATPLITQAADVQDSQPVLSISCPHRQHPPYYLTNSLVTELEGLTPLIPKPITGPDPKPVPSTSYPHKPSPKIRVINLIPECLTPLIPKRSTDPILSQFHPPPILTSHLLKSVLSTWSPNV
jgi:hypothetical protein